MNSVCKNCHIEFESTDDRPSRKAKYCSRECHYEHKRKICIVCESDYVKHRTYKCKKTGKIKYKRICVLCEKEKRWINSHRYYVRHKDKILEKNRQYRQSIK